MEPSQKAMSVLHSSKGHTMFAYELHRLRHADLVRRADHERQVREAVRLRRAAARNTGSESHTRRIRRSRLARAA